MTIDLTDEIIEAGARALAMLEPNEEWPSNAALGGNATGTRDDEYRAAVHEQAHMAAAALAPLIEAAVREQIARDIEALVEHFREGLVFDDPESVLHVANSNRAFGAAGAVNVARGKDTYR